MLTGAVLAGGKSRRYGRNKAFEIFQGRRLVDRSVESLRPFCDPVLLVANDLQLYFDVEANLVQDILMHQGPLGGVYTALLFSPHDWVFVKATDMPFLISGLPTMMLNFLEGFDVVVPVCKGLYEPLLALYSRRCIPSVASALGSGKRQVISFYEKVRIREVSEELWRSVDPQGLSFRNINSPGDLEGMTWS